MIFWCLVIAAAYLFYKWAVANNDYFAERGVAFLKPVFLVGSNLNMFYNRKPLPRIINNRYNDSQVSKEKIFGIFEFRIPVLYIRDPKLAKQMAIKDFEYFLNHRPLIDENTDKLFGKALLSLQGQKWRDMRATLSPMFTGSKMRQMYNFVASVGQQSANTIKDQIKIKGDNVFEFKELAMRFTVDVIATSAFGIEVNSFKDPENDFHKIAKQATDLTDLKTMMKFVGYLTIPAIMKAFKVSLFSKDVKFFFHEAVLEMMRVREEKGIVRNDMIYLLMQAKKGKLSHEPKEAVRNDAGFATVQESEMGKAEVQRAWDDEDIAAQAFIFFFAGFDTVATTMSFLAHELTANPKVQEKLFAEVQAMEDELNGKAINYEQIQGLKYMDQVVCETMRLWPAIPMTDRTCVKDYSFEVDGKKLTIEKGRFIIIPVVAYHHDPKYFPEPEKFIPERFSEENRHNIDPDTYLPFGIGPRNCIGSRFALMEVKTIIYYLIRSFSFEVTAKTQIPLKLNTSPLSLNSEKGIWIGLKPRN